MTDDPLSRREILTGHLRRGEPEIHVSSLVLHCRPVNVPAIRARLAAMPGVEIHAESGGKLVVTLETADEGGIVTRMNDINLIEGVMSASLVFHQFESDTSEEAFNRGG